jgi:plastocyanin
VCRVTRRIIGPASRSLHLLARRTFEDLVLEFLLLLSRTSDGILHGSQAVWRDPEIDSGEGLQYVGLQIQEDHMRVLLACLAVVLGLSSASAENVVVEVQNFAFVPDVVDINTGDTVQWVWIAGSHTTTSGTDCTGDGLWNAPVNMSNPSFEFTFTDEGVFPYFCIPHCGLGMTGVVNVEAPSSVDGDLISTADMGLGAYPNPVQGRTELRFRLTEPGRATIEIVDVLGRRVRSLHEGTVGAGVHTVAWTGDNDSGRPVPAGMYFARLITDRETRVTKLFMVR